MLTVCLTVLLSAEAQVPDLDTLAPPPLVPLEEMPTPAEQLDDPDVVDTARVEREAAQRPDGEGFSIGRVAAVGGASAGIGGLLVGSAVAFLANSRDTSTASMLLLLSLPTSLFVGSAIGFAVHRAMGGVGGYGAHLGGGAIGGALGLLLCFGLISADNGRFSVGTSIGGVFSLAVLFGAGSALFGELSNFRTLRESGVAVSVAPVRGGAIAMAGLRW